MKRIMVIFLLLFASIEPSCMLMADNVKATVNVGQRAKWIGAGYATAGLVVLHAKNWAIPKAVGKGVAAPFKAAYHTVARTQH